MGSTFSTYNIAATGMYVNQAALTTVSQNLSNVNTTGYTRQRTNTLEQYTNLSGGKGYGSGVQVESVTRIRDTFLDATYRTANAQTAYYDTKNTLLEDAQKLLNEYGSSSDSSDASTNGLQQTISDFFDSWDQLTKDADSQTARKSVLEYAGNLITAFNEIDEQLSEIQSDAVSRISDDVDTLNTDAAKIAKLNVQIVAAKSAGDATNDLEDQRDELVDELSKLTSLSVQNKQDGSLAVYIGGISLVDGQTTRTLAVDTGTDGQSLSVKWTKLDVAADITSGSMGAYLEEADDSGFSAIADTSNYNFSTTASASNLTTMRQGLNDLLTTIASQVNTLLTSGTDLEGNAGTALFVKSNSSQDFILGNIEVNSALTDDVEKIAAGTTGAAADGTVANKIVALKDSNILICDTSSMDVTDFYQALISWISTTGDTASSNYDTQSALLNQADNQREAISEVSQDEEMSNMIVYQNAYNASARVLNTIDSLIGGLIDDLGSRLG